MISQNGYLPHIYNHKFIDNRINMINNKIKLLKESIPIVESNENSAISITNNKSTLPQIINFKCNEDIISSHILIKNLRKKISYKEFSTCDIDNVGFTINNSSHVYKLKNIIEGGKILENSST